MYYKVLVFSDVTLCSLVASNERFVVTSRFNFQSLCEGSRFFRNVGYYLPLDIGLILLLSQYCLRVYQDW